MARGFLAIWCDIGADDRQEYRNWLMQEHIADRIALPGFLGVRLFEAPDDPLSHFILYATESPQVLHSPTYRAALDNPSPWTRRIMPRFGPFDRAAGAQALKLGNGFGASLAVARIRTDAPSSDPARLRADLAPFMELSGTVAVRLMAVDRDATGIETEERKMREGPEGAFSHLLCVETIDTAAARRAEAAISATLGGIFPGYRGHDVSARRMIYGEAPHEGPFGAAAAG